MKKNAVSQDFNLLYSVYEKGLDEALEDKDIENLTLYGKCYVIKNLASALRDKVPHKKHGTGTHTRASLVTIAESFEPSDHLLGLQYKKRNTFLNTMSTNENSDAFNTLRNWDACNQEEKEAAIIHTTRLHQRVYLTGIALMLPVEHVFIDNSEKTYIASGKKILGGFLGNLTEQKGRITQNLEDLILKHTPLDALHTAHHEATHAIQFSLANAFHHGYIRQDHMLYDDARIFHAIEVSRAIIPFSILKAEDTGAYTAQIHERLAEDEGRLISHDLVDLVNS